MLITHYNMCNSILAVFNDQDLRNIIFTHKLHTKLVSYVFKFWYKITHKPLSFNFDAFSKWGDNCECGPWSATKQVVMMIEDLGYDCCGNPTTKHYDRNKDWRRPWKSKSGLPRNSEIIRKIVRASDGVEVYPGAGNKAGSSGDALKILPNDILDAILFNFQM